MRPVKTRLVPADPLARRGFRSLLQAELAARCARNSRYSLRAFALDLGCDHSSLSQMLRGARRTTERTIRDLGARLGLPSAEIEEHVARARALGAGDDGAAERLALERDEDTLAVLTDLEHFALLELVRIESFRPDSSWIARVLGIDVDRVNVIVQRLLRLGMLRMAAPDRWRDCTGERLTVHAELPRETVPRLLAGVRRRTAAAFDGAATEREHASVTVATDGATAREILRRSARFREELAALLAQGAPGEEVYQLEINFFPLTRVRHLGEED
jgi:hypothetical protein